MRVKRALLPLLLGGVLATACSGKDDDDNNNYNQNSNANANSNVNVNGNNVEGCGFPPTGATGAVTVNTGSPVSLNERSIDAQTTVDLDHSSQLPADSLSVVRYSTCGDVGLLVRTDDGIDVRLQYADPTVTDSLEVVEATANANTHDAVLFYDADCTAVVVRATTSDGLLEYTRGTTDWTRAVVLDDFSGVLGAAPTSLRLVDDFISPDGRLHVILHATVNGVTLPVRSTRDPAASSPWSHTALPALQATDLFGYAVDDDDVTYAIFRNTEYPCDPCDMDFYLGTLASGATDWDIQIVQPGLWGAPNDEFVERASIALDSAGTVFMAAHFVRRVITGSYVSAELRLYGPMNTEWCGEVVADTSDGYEGGQGDSFTGADPQLVIDDQDRFHILFRDQTIWHDGDGYENQIRGQLRYAARSGTRWYLHTLLAQDGQLASPDPLVGLSAPRFAMSPDAARLTGAAVIQTWQTDSIYNDDAVPATLAVQAVTADITYP